MTKAFTYIDSIVTGIEKVMERAPSQDEQDARYKIYNIGNNHPEDLLTFVDILEACLRRDGIITQAVKKEFLPMQPGDVYQTFADISDLEKDFGFRPKTSLEEGLDKFAKWYKEYYLPK